MCRVFFMNRFLANSFILAILLLGLATNSWSNWQRWERCTLLTDRYMDGDSFYIKTSNGRVYIIRIYFVDAPETDDRFPDRLEEQAEYFGISVRDNLRVGDMATKFAQQFMREPFTVHTRRQTARGASDSPRFFGFIENSQGKFLHEELVRNGLGRVHGMPAARPDGLAAARVWSRLRAAREEAKERKVGAWRFNPEIERSARFSVMNSNFEPGKKITTTGTIYIYSESPPHDLIGALRGGAELTLHEIKDNQYVIVSFEVDGETMRGACLRRDLNL